MDKAAGKPKGTAFVEFKTEEAAKKAAEACARGRCAWGSYWAKSIAMPSLSSALGIWPEDRAPYPCKVRLNRSMPPLPPHFYFILVASTDIGQQTEPKLATSVSLLKVLLLHNSSAGMLITVFVDALPSPPQNEDDPILLNSTGWLSPLTHPTHDVQVRMQQTTQGLFIAHSVLKVLLPSPCRQFNGQEAVLSGELYHLSIHSLQQPLLQCLSVPLPPLLQAAQGARGGAVRAYTGCGLGSGPRRSTTAVDRKGEPICS